MHLTARLFLLSAVLLLVFSQDEVSLGPITNCAFDSMWVTLCSGLRVDLRLEPARNTRLSMGGDAFDHPALLKTNSLAPLYYRVDLLMACGVLGHLVHAREVQRWHRPLPLRMPAAVRQ